MLGRRGGQADQPDDPPIRLGETFMSTCHNGLRPLKFIALAAALLTPGLFAATARADELVEPRVLSSKNGVLDLLMIAKTSAITTMAPYTPSGWAYEICELPSEKALTCPDGTPTDNLYGGTRLQLKQGDLLKIRLVNQLPRVTDSQHASETGMAYLRLNPTNLHTHGMLVSPRYPTVNDPTYGDNVFVMTLNPLNGQPPKSSQLHGDVRELYTDYRIQIPANHPSGLFWFHPHVHGISKNQISAGMSGLITVGDISDYVCKDLSCSSFLHKLPTRHMMLKDSQIMSDSSLRDEEEAGYCDLNPDPNEIPRQGSCAGLYDDGGGGGSAGVLPGRWYFPINGQTYPSITMASGNGEIWRLTNASPSATYDLRLWDSLQNRDMIVQVLAIDGVAVQAGSGTDLKTLRTISGTKIEPTNCPKSGTIKDAHPLCATRLLMMPSSRVELWVTYRDASGKLAHPPAGDSVIFKTAGVDTGPGGDKWPTIDLATVTFAGTAADAAAPQVLSVADSARKLRDPQLLAADLRSANAAVDSDPSCKPLAKGHMRRIFFNIPTADANLIDYFGLGYEELDEKGNPVPGTFQDVAQFNPDTPTICIPLGPGNTPVHERWQLVNIANEDHNFHIHQTKFSVLTKDELDHTGLPRYDQGVLLHDNVPLLHATGGTCASVDDWRNGVCTAHPVTVDIPFAIAGDFVYHCHILEHEDGGMMARIRVRPTP
jgi:FtsP/CotA-like multicopper oxidase with cupredoxin domain